MAVLTDLIAVEAVVEINLFFFFKGEISWKGIVVLSTTYITVTRHPITYLLPCFTTYCDNI